MKKNVYLIAALVLLFACKRENEEFEGPDVQDYYGEFYMISDLELSAQTIDFSTGERLVFDAELSRRTPWLIEINGLTSGAVATIKGNERVMDSETAVWKGGANSFPGFSLEQAAITITFPNEGEQWTRRDTITITGRKQDSGYLITSFEDGAGPNWLQWSQSTVAAGIKCGDNNAAQGDCYYSFSGTVGWDWAIGSVTLRPDEGTFPLPNDPSNLFFNLGIKGEENISSSNSFILFWFDEDDNGDGVFDESAEDRFVYEYWIPDTTWNIFSLNYGDLQFDAEGNQVETSGNGLPEPSKLISVNVFFLANPNTGVNSKCRVDHAIFTTNEPYKP